MHRHSIIYCTNESSVKMGTTIQARRDSSDLDALLQHSHMEHGVIYCHFHNSFLKFFGLQHFRVRLSSALFLHDKKRTREGHFVFLLVLCVLIERVENRAKPRQPVKLHLALHEKEDEQDISFFFSSKDRERRGFYSFHCKMFGEHIFFRHIRIFFTNPDGIFFTGKTGPEPVRNIYFSCLLSFPYIRRGIFLTNIRFVGISS